MDGNKMPEQSGDPQPKGAFIGFKLRDDEKRLIRSAASIQELTITDFVLSAAMARARRVADEALDLARQLGDRAA